MDFGIKIRVDTSAAQGQPEKVTDGLDKLVDAEARANDGAKKLSGGLAELGAALGVAGKETTGLGEATDKATGLTGRQLKILADIQAPAKEYAEQLRAIKGLLDMGALSVDQYQQQLIKLQRATGETNSAEAQAAIALERQAAVLERIRGPMQKYEQDVAALDALMAKGTITALEYEEQFQKLAKQYGTMHGPVAPGPAPAPSAPAALPIGGGDTVGTLTSALGGAGSLLAGGAVGAAVVGMGQHIQGLIDQYHDLQDTWTNASNTALKFTDSLHSTNLIIDEQIKLAHDLHSTESATIELYDTIRDGTDDLNVSHREQITLTRALGEEVQLAGKSLDAAGGIVTRLSFAMARGSITTGELARIMRQVPELGDLWTKSFNTDRQGLLAMVRAGQVGVEALMRPLLEESEQIHKNFQLRQELIKQKEEEWKLNEKLYSQKYGVTFGAGNFVESQVQAFKQMDQTQLKAIAESGGAYAGIAAQALKQYSEEFNAGMQEAIDNVKNLTGFLRPVGDIWREWVGDTAGVRAEITKINEPLDAARAELDKLNTAFKIGKIDVIDYEKHWAELQTTIGHGVGPQAFKITEPIRVAKEELKRFLNEIEAGADVTQAQARKAIASHLTAMNAGITPEDIKLNVPKQDARDALADLIAKQKEGKITGESFRHEYESLVTTINDGRLPEAIKIWNGIHDPIDQAARDFRALHALLVSGRIAVGDYTVEIDKVAKTGKSFDATLISEGVARQDALLARGIITLQEYEAAIRKLATTAAESRRIGGVDITVRQDAHPDKIASQLQGVTGGSDIQASIAAVRDASQPNRELAEQLERVRILGNETVVPLVKYEQTIGDISDAIKQNRLTQEEATVQQRKARDEYESAEEALHKIKSPLEQYQLTLKHLDQQLHDQQLNQSKYNDAVVKAKEQLLTDTGGDKTFLGSLQLQWIKLKQEADSFGATVANQLVGDVGKLNDALVTAANGGTVAWGQMADAILQDLERIALRMLEIKAITAIADAVSPGSGAAVGAAAGAIGHAANGFDGVVAGPGSTDSKLFASWVSPGERVTIAPPGAYPSSTPSYAGRPAPASSTRAPVVHVHNHYDTGLVTAAIDSRAGNQSVINVLRANQGAVRSYSGTRR